MFDLPCLCLTFCYEPGGRRHQMCRPADGHPSNQPKWHVACQCHVSCGPWTVLHVTYLTLYSYTSLTSVYNILQLTHSCLLVSATGRPGCKENIGTPCGTAVCFSCALDIDPRHLSTKLHQFASQQNTGPYRTIPQMLEPCLHGSSWIFMANVCLRSSMMIQKPRGIANDCNARKKLIHTDRILIYPLVPRQGCIWNDTSLKSLSVGNQLPSQPAAHERCSSNSSSRICSLHPFAVEKYGKVWKS